MTSRVKLYYVWPHSCVASVCSRSGVYTPETRFECHCKRLAGAGAAVDQAAIQAEHVTVLRAPLCVEFLPEIFFRDSANGFLAWAAATILVAAVLSSGLSSLISGAGRTAAAVGGGAAQGAMQAAGSGSSADSSSIN